LENRLHRCPKPGDDAKVLLGRNDRVLLPTRLLGAVIIPFLLGAFAILYCFPQDTARLFAWPIRPTMTPMVLASAYFGGAYFFLRVLWERHWNAIKTGFVAVAMFAALLGVATIVHWDKFSHQNLTFWIWATLYFTTPFLVLGAWFSNQGVASPPSPDELRLSRAAQWTIGLVGLVALVQGLTMFLAPTLVLPYWPWLLTLLTCRVMGAIFCLGSAGLAVLRDPRWSSVKLLLQVEMIMVVLILLAAVRALPEIEADKVLTWLLGAGFVGVLAGSIYLWVSMSARARGRTTAR
jgi:hypothetical protein